MGVKMGWIQIKMGHPLARNGAALAPFRANGVVKVTFDILRRLLRMRAYEQTDKDNYCRAPKREANKRRTGEVLFDLGVRTYVRTYICL